MKDQKLLQELADRIWAAQAGTTPIEPFSQEYPELTIEDSREIQMINIRRRVAMGHRIVGKKVGATNQVMRELLHLKEPVMGYLLSDIVRHQSQPIQRSTQINPFIECEMMFVMAERLEGPNVMPHDVLRCVAGAMPAIEVPDIRYTGAKNMVDALADNVYNGYLVVGDTMADVRGLDFSNIPVTLYKNGEVASANTSAAAMGSPILVVAWLANKLYSYGECLEKGDIVITGSLNPAVYIEAGDRFVADFGPLGRVQAIFE